MRIEVGRARAAAMIVGSVVVGAVVSGCGGPVQAGSAVIVGPEAISLEQVQARITQVLADPGTQAQAAQSGEQPPDVARSVVSTEVLTNLVTKQAAALGITVPDAAVDAELVTQYGQDAAGQVPAEVRENLRTALMAVEVGRRVVDATTTVTVDQVSTTNRADAERLATVVAAGGPAADAVFADPRTAKRGVVETASLQPDEALGVPFGLPVGSVAAFQPSSSNAGWSVARVTARGTAPGDPRAADSLGRDQLFAIGLRNASLVGNEAGVRVNPRYGEWDPIANQVVAEGQTTGLVITPAG